MNSLPRHKGDTNRRSHLEAPAGGRQAAVLGIDPKDDHVVRALVRGQQERSGRVNGEIPRRFALCRSVLDEGQSPRRLVDRKDRDTVMAAVRAVEEPAVRMHGDLRGRTLPFEGGGQRRDSLHFREPARGGVIAKRGDRRIQFADHVGEPAVRVKREVARSGTGFDRGEGRRIDGGQRALVRVEPVDHDPVQAEVGHEGEAIGGIEVDAVGVRAFLAARVHARTLVLEEAASRAECPIGLQPDHRHAPAAVIRHQHVPTGLVHDQMAGASAPGALLVQESQLAGVGLDGERADRTGRFALEVAHLVHGVEEQAVRMQCQVTRAGGFNREDRRGEGTGRQIQGGEIDPLALRAGIRADVNADPSGGRLGSGCERRGVNVRPPRLDRIAATNSGRRSEGFMPRGNHAPSEP